MTIPTSSRLRRAGVTCAVVWLLLSLVPTRAVAQTEEPNPIFDAIRAASEQLAVPAEQAGAAFTTVVDQIRAALVAAGPAFENLDAFTSQLGQAVEAARGALDQVVAGLAPLLAALAPFMDQASAGVAAAELAAGDGLAGQKTQFQQMGSALTSNPVTAAPLCGFQRPGGIALSLLPGALRAQEAFAALTAPCADHPPSGPPSQFDALFDSYATMMEDASWALAPVAPVLQPGLSVACPMLTPFSVIPIFFPSPAPIGPVASPLSFFACSLGEGASAVGPVMLFAAVAGEAVTPSLGQGGSLLKALAPATMAASPLVFPHTAGACALVPLVQTIPTLLLPFGAPSSPSTVIAPIGTLACAATSEIPRFVTPPPALPPPGDLAPPQPPGVLALPPLAPPAPYTPVSTLPGTGPSPGPIAPLLTFQWIYLALLGLITLPTASKATRGAIRRWARDPELVDIYRALRA